MPKKRPLIEFPGRSSAERLREKQQVAAMPRRTHETPVPPLKPISRRYASPERAAPPPRSHHHSHHKHHSRHRSREPSRDRSADPPNKHRHHHRENREHREHHHHDGRRRRHHRDHSSQIPSEETLYDHQPRRERRSSRHRSRSASARRHHDDSHDFHDDYGHRGHKYERIDYRTQQVPRHERHGAFHEEDDLIPDVAESLRDSHHDGVLGSFVDDGHNPADVLHGAHSRSRDPHSPVRQSADGSHAVPVGHVAGQGNYYGRDPAQASPRQYPEGTQYSDETERLRAAAATAAVGATGTPSGYPQDRQPYVGSDQASQLRAEQPAHQSGIAYPQPEDHRAGPSERGNPGYVGSRGSYGSGELNSEERYAILTRRRRERDPRHRYYRDRHSRRSHRHHRHRHRRRHPRHRREPSYSRRHRDYRHSKSRLSEDRSYEHDEDDEKRERRGAREDDSATGSAEGNSSRPTRADEDSSGSDEEAASGLKGKLTKKNVFKGTLLTLGAVALGMVAKKALKKRKEKKEEDDDDDDSELAPGEAGVFNELMYRPPLPEAKLFSVKVPQNQACIVERGGKYHRKLNAGSNSIMPFVDNIAYCHSLKEMMMPVPKQQCYSKDNHSLRANGILSFRIEDPVAASYGVDNPYRAVVLLAQTCLRKEVGKIALSKAYEDRIGLADRIMYHMNDACRPWGVRIVRFEVRDLEVPYEVKATLDREAEAETQKRLQIIQSEAEREAAINRAEGQLQAQMKLSQARQMEIVNQAIGEAHAITERGEAVAHAMRDVADAVSAPGGEQAMHMRIAEQYIHAYGHAARGSVVPPPDPNDLASSMNNALGLLNTLGQPGNPTAIPVARTNPFVGPPNDPNTTPPTVFPHIPDVPPPAPHSQPGPGPHAYRARANAAMPVPPHPMPPSTQQTHPMPPVPLHYPQPQNLPGTPPSHLPSSSVTKNTSSSKGRPRK